MISEPLKPGFVLSEKTINMNDYLAAIEAGLRSKTAAEMQLERRTTAAASQQSAQASGSSAGAGWTASGKAA
jgi:formate dehydrogenase assembly factor FdhD